MPKPRMKDQIAELERTLKIEQRGIEHLRTRLHETEALNLNLKIEVDGLKRDKEWLKTLVQNLTGNRNALPR